MRRGLGSAEVDHFDLFPFISILICTLGCLLMITMSVVALSLGPAAAEIWKIEGGRGKLPVLIEWDGEEITIHPRKVRLPWAIATRHGGRNDSEFGRLIGKLREQRERRYLFVAVRPSGFGNLHHLLALLERQQVRVGFEPIEQDRKVGIAEGERL